MVWSLRMSFCGWGRPFHDTRNQARIARAAILDDLTVIYDASPAKITWVATVENSNQEGESTFTAHPCHNLLTKWTNKTRQTGLQLARGMNCSTKNPSLLFCFVCEIQAPRAYFQPLVLEIAAQSIPLVLLANLKLSLKNSLIENRYLDFGTFTEFIMCGNQRTMDEYILVLNFAR